MAGYIARRLLALIPILFLVSIFAFLIVHITPGDPVSRILGDQATVEDVERARRELGLDRPVHVQYLQWLGAALRGDLGRSLFVNQPVSTMLLQRAEPTLLLAAMSLLITLLLGIPAGVIAAIHNNTWADHSVMLVALFAVAMPNFWLGLNLILLFSIFLGWFPVAGYSPISDGFLPAVRSMILPAVTLGFSQAALIARMTRASMLEVLSQDYVRTARAKGLANRSVYLRHALKNALLPTTTVIGVVVIGLFGGAVVTETVFNIPGAGRLVVNAVIRRDFPVLQGAILVIAAMYVLVNLAVDLLYAYIDPRIRYT